MISFALVITAHTQIVTASQIGSSDDAEKIRRSIDEVETAFVSREAEPFERIYLDGYVGIRGKTVYNAREHLLAMVRWDALAIKAGKKLDFETLAYEGDTPKIRVYGDAAIVTSLKKNLWRYKNDKCLSHYQSTELWVRPAGEWKIAVGHMSTIQCDPLPWQPPHPAVADTRTITRPSKFLSPSAETEIRELISKLSESGTTNDSGKDAFTQDFESTDLKNEISSDRTGLLQAFKTPAVRGSERYKDDEVFLSYGNAAAYFFRIRFVSKAGEQKPEPPVTFSVFFVKHDGGWKIASSHASSLVD